MADSHHGITSSEANKNNNAVNKVNNNKELVKPDERIKAKKPVCKLNNAGQTAGADLQSCLAGNHSNPNGNSRTDNGNLRNDSGNLQTSIGSPNSQNTDPMFSQTMPTAHNSHRPSNLRGTSLSDDLTDGTRKLAAGSDQVEVHGFLLVSWKIRQFSQLENALKPGVIALQYKNDSTLETILHHAEKVLDGRKICQLGFIGHGSPGKMSICYDQALSVKASAADQNEVMDFFRDLVDVLVDRSNANARLDFLACPLVANNDGIQVLRSLEDFIKVPVFATKELTGSDVTGKGEQNKSMSDFYLKAAQLRTWSGTSNQSISKFEKIRTVGKGSYGTAVLYRKKDDDSLVVLKEINIHDLNANERLMAKNEVTVLSMLSHPNIISYYDSFEEEGTLWIEMEYADGGTLAQYLLKLDKELEEQEILLMFQQMVSAIKYIHEHNILHRDLKTANIFLTKDGKVKLGDFGIAKIMSTRQDANTVLGTPYYISPEMCEGKTYNEKSDMWALGCILYEMANLQKTFEGTNLPALVNKIMKGSFAPVKEIFSVEFRVLVRDLLSREPSLRPSAQELLIYRLPELLEKFDTHTGRDDLDIAGSGTRRSLLYYADVSTGMLYQVHGLPSKMHITEVSVGLSHVVVVSMERGIFCWGDNTYGQLGVDDQIERESPTEVVGLRGKSILRASCGDDFTAFLSDNGLLLTCGRGDYGCLGHGNWTTLLKPKLNDELLTRDVISLSCGRHHVAVASADGAAFTWGLGDDGRLGLGADESRRCTPCEVDFSETVAVREVRCSADGTVFIMDTGVIFACGKNNCNKLRLNPRQGFLQQIKLSRANKSIESVKTATLVKDLCRYQIADICFGSNHSAILTEAGLVATMGSNTEGQLGYGHTKSRDMLTNVKGLEEEQIYTIACGVTFTLAGTRNNAVFFWGSKRSTRTQSHSESSPSPSQSMNSASASKSLRSRKSSLGSFEEPAPAVDKSGSFGTEMDMTDWRSDSEGRGMKRQDSSGPKKSRADSAKSLPDKTSIQGSISDSVFDCEADKVDQRRQNFLRNIARKKHGEISTGLLKMADKESQAVVLPAKIFEFTGLSGIEGYDESDEYPVYLQDIKCSFDHVFLQLDTIAPSPKRRKRLSRKESKQKFGSKLDESSSSVASHGQDELNSSEASGMDLTGNVPSWIKDELKGGIPVDASAEASNEDSSDTDQSEAVNTTNHNSTPSNAPKATVIRKPSSSSAATSQQAPERFVFRRTSNHSITRHRELRNKIISSSNSSQATLNEAPATAGALNEAPKTETTIVDGVAITTTTSLTTPTQLISSPTPTHGNSSRSSSVTEIEMSPTPRSTSKVGASYGENTDQGITVGQRPKMAKQACAVVNSEQSMNLSQVFPRPASTPSKRNSEQIRDIGGVAAGPVKNMFADSGVEFTPVESFTSETELSSSKKSSEDRMNNRKSASSSGERPRNGKPRKPQPHNQTRERANEIRSRGVARGRLGPSKGKGTYNIERNAMREDEAAKLCEQLRAMRDLHEKQEKHLESVKREAMESELRLKHQIEKLRLEKSEAAQDLHHSQEEHLRLAEAKMVVQREESARREAHLQSEVTMLKDELRSQSEKLQESFNMLITVQEQMLKMQQEQFKIQQQNQMTDSGSISQMSSKDVQSPGMLSPRESNQRSKTPTSISSNQSKSAVCSVM